MHTPYSAPVASFLITVLPPTWPQYTDAGFAIPVAFWTGAAVVTTTFAVGTGVAAVVEGVVAPFDICSAASKPETNYPWIGPTTNHPYCPSLKSVLNEVSKVSENVNYIPEIVLNGLNQKVLEEGMKAGIEAVIDFDDVSLVSAGNYNGLLEEYRIDLRSLFE